MTTTQAKDLLQRFGSWVFVHVRDLIVGVFMLLDVAIDWFYNRTDMWHNRGAKVVDYSKLRGFILYTAVVYVVIYVVRHTTNLPLAWLQNVLLGMLSLAAGERVLTAFLKAWSSRGIADTAMGAATLVHSMRDAVQGVDVGPEPPTKEQA